MIKRKRLSDSDFLVIMIIGAIILFEGLIVLVGLAGIIQWLIWG